MSIHPSLPGRRLSVLANLFLLLTTTPFSHIFFNSHVTIVTATTTQDQIQPHCEDVGADGTCIMKDAGMGSDGGGEEGNMIIKEPILPEQEGGMSRTENNDNDSSSSSSGSSGGDSGNSTNDICEDKNDKCLEWVSQGQCRSNRQFMTERCMKSCGLCEGDYGEDDDDDDDDYDEDEIDPLYGTEYGVRQAAEGDQKQETTLRIKEMEKYMAEEVFSDSQYASVRHDCKNRHELCAYWAMIGECDANPKYMAIECAPACFSCKKLDMNERCPIDDNAVDSLLPGELNKLFERIVESPEYGNKTTIYSRPLNLNDINDGSDGEGKVKDGPWVITIDEFITEEETERLIALGAEQGYKRSTDVGKKKYDGSYEEKQSSTRTSFNAWCQDGCFDDPLSKSVTDKIEILTGIPDENSENLQLLRYYEGQFYRPHHDFIPHHVDRRPGPRIMTAFLYLNDVEEGGGTNFPLLDITVMPKRGKLLLWPSVKDSDLNKEDSRTKHQALAVEKGVKYAANGWIHLREFKKANDAGCI